MLLKRSARYVLVQRGFIVLMFMLAAVTIALFTRLFSQFFQTDCNLGMALSAVFGIVLVWASAPVVKRGTERIDRAFFRSAYDAHVILQDLAKQTRTVTDRHELAKLLGIQIEGALHPKSLACYLDAGDGNLVAECGPASRESGTIPAALPRPKFPFRFGAMFVPRESDTIPATLPLLREIAQRGKAWDTPQGHEAAGDLGTLAPECLVPILGRDSGLTGLLVLGPRLSEEPYSREDKHVLDSVASQAGITLENIGLAEKMAERLEARQPPRGGIGRESPPKANQPGWESSLFVSLHRRPYEVVIIAARVLAEAKESAVPRLTIRHSIPQPRRDNSVPHVGPWFPTDDGRLMRFVYIP